MIGLLKILLSISVLLLCACTPKTQSLLAEQAICVPIGIEEERDLCVLNIHNWNHNYWTNSYYMAWKGNISDVVGLGGGFQTYEMLVSPSKKYIAITEDAGEGHPYLMLLSLSDIRSGVKPTSVASMDAYPGGFYDLRWVGDILSFSAETDLMPQEEKTAHPDLEYTWRYQLDAATGKLVQLSGSVLD